MSKIPFFKLERTCSMCPSQWEYMSPKRDFSCYIRYRSDKLQVFLCQNLNQDEFDCLDSKYIILSVDNVSGDPWCGYLEDDTLHDILMNRGLLEG